ncbi:hypothetical protein A3K81_06380 [Candidatus Bathyarchaeota archaeon RBG_13_60_20]|jgi:hypothetical protein|nr:MAG: hypothetical protein A3K81_06380 [Candidatus Bathyarchaeota archaeon RBG_13_60_20]
MSEEDKCPYCGSEISPRKARKLTLQHKLEKLYGKRSKYVYDTSNRARTTSDELSIEISGLLNEMRRHSRRTRAYELIVEE